MIGEGIEEREIDHREGAMMRIGLLTREQVLEYWPAIQEWIVQLEVPWYETHPDDLAFRAMSGQMQVWVALGEDEEVKATVFTRVESQPRGSVLVVCGPAVGKDLSEWMEPLYQAAVKYCKVVGLEWIQIDCRPGFEPKLRTLGFRTQYVSLVRPVNGLEH